MRPINLMAPVNQLGYGVAGYNLLKSLVKGGNFVSYYPIGKVEWEGDPEAKKIIESAFANSRMLDFTAPSVKIWHQNDMGLFPGRGPRAGFPIFELNRFDDAELHHLRSLDRIVVCSEWAKRVIEDNNIRVPTHVVPLGVDKEMFNINPLDRQRRPYWSKDATVFINVGKWEVRKGHNELLEAFNKAFTEKDNVELQMINENPFIGIENEAWKQKYIESPLGSKIKIRPRMVSQHQMREVFNQADFGVFPSHAEGWNLEILELMACGAQIIATNYSGHTEYLNESNSLLINPVGMETAQDGKWFRGQGEWCKFSVDDLVEAMRLAHKNKQVGVKGPDNQSLVDKYSWQNSANKLLEAVS